MPNCVLQGLRRRVFCASARLGLVVALGWWTSAGNSAAQTNYLDNETLYRNQDPNTETRRSDHFRICFGHFNRDTGTPMTEQLAQGNLQMFEQMWRRWVVEMGLHDINESVTRPDGNKYRANFNVLMTWNDGGGGGAYSSMDGNGFFYAMANSGYCRFDPPSGATPHEFGHVWEGSCAGFNGSDSSGAWWECTANWMQLQFLNSYPQAGGYIANGIYYPCHGRDYYDSFMIWETAKEDPRYGAAWVNNVWTNADATQRTSEFILDRMIRLDASGSPDKPGALKDLWGDMARKMVTWDFERQRWLAQANRPDDGSDWYFYQRCRTPLVRMPGAPGWFRPERSHLPMQFGFNIIPLAATPGAAIACNFQPDCDPVRQSDWRACLVAVSTNGQARYSSLWNKGVHAMNLSVDETRLYLAVIATPKPMKIADPVWAAYLSDAGLQFPYRVSFTGTGPMNVTYPPQSRTSMHQHPNGDGWVANTATVDATAYVGPNAQVLNTAQVRNNARIEDWAVVRNSAQVSGNAVVSGHAMVESNAKVYGNAKVRDWARVFGYAEIYENGKVIEHANCGDGNATTHTKVYGSAVVKGTTYVYDTSTFAGGIIVDGDTANGNGTTAATHGVHFGWSWGADAARFAGLTNNDFIYAQHTFEKDNAVFALDQFGINHGFLMNGCRIEQDTNAPTRGGRVLPLDGVSQYVELHHSVSDFKDTAIAAWLKWTGGAADQRVWSFGDGAGKMMYLTPNDSTTGGLRLLATDGIATESLGGGALAANTWTHIAVVFSGTASNAILYLNGAPVATNSAVTLFPDSLSASLMENANYLGRGNAGNFFQGFLDDFRVYMKSLSAAQVTALYSAAAPAPVAIPADTTAPTPNAAAWLVSPTAISDSAITMSATPGTDTSGWVEYYFACTAGGGHDSGWVCFNKYTDVGLTPGAACSYTVQMRDRNGNTTTASTPATASTPTSTVGTASFAYGPVGISSNTITMTATKGTNASGHTEYLFSRSGKSSGWQASPTWTDTGLTSGSSYTYTVQMRDGRGNVGAASSGVTAMARDLAAPILPHSYAQWSMLPYATIDNKISMTAQSPTTSDASGVEYSFRCTSSNAPDSGWQASSTYLTPALADGTYTFEYRVRDRSASNESPASASYSARITPTTGYHPYHLSQVLTNLDDYLVSFTATVMKVNANNYEVKDLASGAAIKVRPSTSNEVTDASLALKNVTVKGHLYTFGGERVITFATLTVAGTPDTRTVSGKVISTTGTAVAGATVYFSDSPGAAVNPIVTATTDVSGNYSRAVTPGTWYVVAAASAYNSATERTVVVSNANVSSINFSLVANALIAGEVIRQSDGSFLAGAAVYFSQSPGASGSPTFTATADASGRYSQPVQDGVWYVCAGAVGHFTSADKMVTVEGALVTNINFALRSSARNIPATNRLLFSAVTDSLPESGNTGPWAQYLPPGGGPFATVGGNPTVAKIDGAKWVRNYRVGTSTGFRVLGPTTAIPCSGVTIVTAARPIYVNPGGEQRGELVDFMYDRLALAVAHTDGRIIVARNGNWGTYGPALAQDRTTILSLVVQPDGSYRVFTNGVQAMTGAASTPDFATNLVPTGSQTFKQYVNIGRNDPDGWSAYEGHIGDVFVYTNALADTERQQLEADLAGKFLNPGYTLSVSAGAGGYVNPGGTVTVPAGGAQSFVITPRSGYVITNVTVDGIPRGALSSYTFSNVTASHALAAFFGPAPCSVTLTNPVNGDSFLAPASVVLEASVTTTRPVARVEFYQGDTKLGEAAAAPYAWTWTNVPAGVYTLTARAFYDVTNRADSSSINIIVINPPPPDVVILSPTVTNVYIPSGVGLVLEANASTIRIPPQLTTAWTQTSGPGTVTFGDSNALSTTATFSSSGTYLLTFTASDGTLQSSAAVTVGYGVTPPPAWTGTAVGTVATGAGYATNAGGFNITAGGAGIQSTGAADDFYFVQQACNRDVQITARVVSIQNVSGSSSRAGVMIRETTARGALEAFMGVTSANGGRFIWRTTTDSASANASSTLSLPHWVRLSRAGNTFTAHTAPDVSGTPGTWTQQGTPQTIPMSSAARVGLAAASGSAAVNGAVVIDKVTVSPAQGNVGPRVHAGPDQAISNATFTARGIASDDGLPNPPGVTTAQWIVGSGPGPVTFGNAFATNSSVTFTHPGAYVLRLTATDGEVRTFDDVLINAAFPSTPAQISNFAPMIGGGGFSFQVTNSTTTSYTLLVSTNLADWFALPGVLQYSNGVFYIVDPAALTQRQRFYRLQHP